MAGLIDSLVPMLERDASHLNTLEEILLDERRALEIRDSEQLQTFVERKAQTLTLLQQSARQKTQLFSQHGLQPSPQRIKSALHKVGRVDVLKLWEDVADKLNACKTLNEVNGRIIFRSQQSLARVMNILRGQDNHQQLYAADGRGNTLGSRTLLANA